MAYFLDVRTMRGVFMKKLFFILTIFVIAVLARPVAFEFTPNITAESVNLAGSFNGWSTEATPMSDDDGDGRWTVTIDLPDGEYQYKFVVNGNVWIQDPNNPKGAPDGFGGSNSVIVVGDWERFLGEAHRGDGEILFEAIWHEQKVNYICDDSRGKAWIRLRAKKGDIEAAHLVIRPESGEIQSLPMRYLSASHPFEWFELDVPFEKAFDYHFSVSDGDIVRKYPPDNTDFSAIPEEIPLFDVPEWPQGRLFYQIFPERFADGDPSNNPEGSVPWGSKPEIDNFMGGDLAGVIHRLPYLDSLGVGAIYFNPIFHAGSNHKYDTWDYFKIDPAFGDDAVFDRLIEEAESRDIRIVLDGVFNHIGYGSPIFQDVVEKGAESEFADWFFVREYPVRGPENPNYESWWGFGSLPKMNTDRPGVREHLFGAIRYWLKRGSAGWRLDVAPDVPHHFWRDFRDTIRTVDNEAFSIGEIWGDGTPWLGGDQFDVVMNYRFRDAMIEFFAKSNITPTEFLDRLGGVIASHPTVVNEAMMNLIGSHDTPRFLTIAGGESWRLNLAMVWSLIWPGAPCIYYGDEIGMTGGADPDCRKAFPWHEQDTWDTELLSTVRYISSLRERNSCLRHGTFRPLLLDDASKTLII
ncbi:MAG TPA: hypothetical protein ENN07_06265, partial [candidate division Zixibacteria bacterium]|nr:hypothetical protein [candidate division Zixibacteria bacterium]